MHIRKSAIAAATVLAMVFTAPASAQLREYQDYETSDAVWQMTTVKIDQGQFERYLEGLKSTWKGANDVAKRLGHIEDYAIYANMAPAGDAFDLVLLIKLSSTQMLAPSRQRHDAFLEAYGQANLDRSNQTVINLYNEIREIQGTYLLREVTIK